ncbi:Methyl-accepting chemotaxis protein I (serine chemoreceptor protein) [hydrothermal vent metagenome]|uniref:Methyl-accepting chemotaxis protein I (Serine chemoreceptor protein) n=1 Tax=hydrothermal vent metagenome TaxID=652676 RepID=A0A3B0VMU8_9ZZZZ
MTIKRSMLLISILIVTLGVISLLSLNYSLKKEAELKGGQVLLAEIDASILMLRRHEKDFLLRKNLKYTQKFDVSIQQTYQKIKQLEQILLKNHADNLSIKQLNSVLKNYQSSFFELVKSYEKVGLDEKSGLQGKLRTAVHAIEFEAKEAKNAELYKDMLMLRRREKDFLLRLDMKYLDKFDNDIISFKNTLNTTNLSHIKNTEVTNLLEYYQKTFHEMVDGYVQAGLDNNSGQQGKMRKTVHKTDVMLKKTEAQISEILQSQVASLSILMNMAIIIIALLALIITTLLSRKVINAVNSLKKTIDQTSQTNDFSLRSSYNAQDEIGDISTAFNQLMSRLHQSIKETNNVVNAIAQGDFSQRITSDLSGDLQTLKQGVNGSAESVEYMMSELEKVLQALNEGNFNVQMNKNVSKEFRDKVDNTLQNLHHTIGSILQVMASVKQGDYSTRVTVDAKGDLNQLKIEVNEAVEALEQAINGISRVVIAQKDGDLTQKITAQYPGQLASLTQAINSTNLKLLNVINDVDQTIISISSASSNVSQRAAYLNELIKEQSVAIEETTLSMEKMSDTVQNNTDSSNNANQAVQLVQNNAQTGESVMQKTIDAMSEIQESSHKISDIVSLIDGIAFQTNLLALNAAVEAARAGEQGRGFAVVAGEVRNLAGKSAEAAKEIKSLIEESVNRINQGTQLASESGEVLKEINASVQEVSEMIEFIANSSVEQAQSVTQVHTTITQINAAMQQNTSLVQETSHSAEEMRQQADELKESIQFFNTQTTNTLSYKE